MKREEAEDKINGREYSSRLKEQYNKIVGSNELFSWANAESTEDDTRKPSAVEAELDPISALLQSNTKIFSKTELLNANHLKFSKLVNANYGHEHESITSSISFHPSQNILMSSGLDRKVKLFEVSHNESQLGQKQYNNISSSQKSKKL